MKTLFYNIKELFQVRENNTQILKGSEMKELRSIKNAFLLIADDLITDYGTRENAPTVFDKSFDVSCKMIIPSYIDTHTGIVYAGNREQEFVERITGLTYDEI